MQLLMKEATWCTRYIQEAIRIRKIRTHSMNRDRGCHLLPDIYSKVLLTYLPPRIGRQNWWWRHKPSNFKHLLLRLIISILSKRNFIYVIAIVHISQINVLYYWSANEHNTHVWLLLHVAQAQEINQVCQDMPSPHAALYNQLRNWHFCSSHPILH